VLRGHEKDIELIKDFMKNKWNVELNLKERNRVHSTNVKGKYRRHKSNRPKRESSGSESYGSTITSYTTSDSSSNICQEQFDLSAWLVNRLGLDVNSEKENNRLEELVVAFREAGFRTLRSVSRIDERAIAAINSKLKAIGKNELELGEELSILSN